MHIIKLQNNNIFLRNNMSKLIKLSFVVTFLFLVTGCTGTIYNKNKDCSYDYFLHPSISLSKAIGGCPTN